MAKMFNLGSPNGIQQPCTVDNLEDWIKTELRALKDAAVTDLVLHVLRNQSAFVRLPNEAILLWRGAVRKQGVYPKYPEAIKAIARGKAMMLDTRVNGPAVAAFAFAKGHRPQRFGSHNQWSIHHLYSGKYPYIGRKETLHAVKLGNHFTQSAGLVATHPVLDAIFDEIPAIAWYYRATAFKLFGYDPDNVFSNEPKTELGFSKEKQCHVLYEGKEDVIAA